MSREIVINGLQLPEKFCDFAFKYKDSEGYCNLRLKKEIDCFGKHLECELAQIYPNEQELSQHTNLLSQYFVADGDYGEPGNKVSDPESIEDIIDFKKIVCFGIAGDGSQYCFDFRENRDTPSVIWWEDDHWRKISNSFEEFISLFVNIK